MFSFWHYWIVYLFSEQMSTGKCADLAGNRQNPGTSQFSHRLLKLYEHPHPMSTGTGDPKRPICGTQSGDFPGILWRFRQKTPRRARRCREKAALTKPCVQAIIFVIILFVIFSYFFCFLFRCDAPSGGVCVRGNPHTKRVRKSILAQKGHPSTTVSHHPQPIRKGRIPWRSSVKATAVWCSTIT